MGYQFVAALRKTFEEFCKSTSITGVHYIVEAKTSLLEKCVWCILQIILLAMATIMISYAMRGVYENPFVTSLESNSYPSQDVPFPGIAICNINKISKTRAMEYAKLLSTKANVSFEYIYNKIVMLGSLYSYEIDRRSEFLNFQKYLEKYGAINNGWRDHLYYIMKNLTTPCSELIRQCYWKGRESNCSELFKLRSTYEGFCCTFNYVRYDRKKPLLTQTDPLNADNVGWRNGLVAFIRNRPDDYFYPTLSTIGVNIHIFNAQDYPDSSSGSLQEEVVTINGGVFFQLEPITTYAVPEIRKYPISVRKCIFDDEIQTIFGKYSFSNCLMECRVKSVIALCQCVPFIMSSNIEAPECTLQDIPCLDKYKDKWENLYPIDYTSDELDLEKENSLFCPNCYADCSRVNYRIITNYVPLNRLNKAYANFSAISIYYGKSHSKVYKLDVTYYWFEMLSNVGGLLGIFLGVSIVSVMELIYFATFRLILTIKQFKL